MLLSSKAYTWYDSIYKPSDKITELCDRSVIAGVRHGGGPKGACTVKIVKVIRILYIPFGGGCMNQFLG